MKNLKELKKAIECIEINYDYETVYSDMYNTMVDYWNDNQEWIGEDLFNDFVDYDTAEYYAKTELESGGLARLYYFIGDVNFAACGNLLRINGYGNLEEVYKDDLINLKDELIDEIERAIDAA